MMHVKRMTSRIGSAWLMAAALVMLVSGQAQAVSRSWVGGSATWDDTTAGNWSPSGAPTNTDSITISQSGISVGYTAANLSGAGLNDFYLHHGGAGTTTFTLDGTDYFPVKLVLAVGRWANSNVVFNLTGNALVTIYGGGSGLILGGSGGTGPFVFNQTGGIISNGISSGSLVYIYSNATYNLSGGSYIANRNLDLHGGTFSQSGGVVVLPSGYGMNINPYSTFVATSGIFTNGGGEITVGTNATVSWAGVVFVGKMGRLKLTGPRATWAMRGYTFTVNPSGTTSASKDSFVTAPASTVQGYGMIQDDRFGASSPATFDNSGRVIANGFGANSTLDLSRFTQTLVTNSIDNTSSNGWFAVNKGNLLLPVMSVTAGNCVTNWGESIGDTTPDLVNSARISFTGATVGSFTGMLYAADSSAVPEGLRKPAGVWSFGGVTCTTAVVTFRYDDAGAAAIGLAENDLKIWRYNGVKWVNVTDTRDNTAKTITSQSIAPWPKAPTFFAVAGSPRGAGAMILIK